MSKKIRVGVLFGGRSAEHEVSLMSAKNVVEAIDKNKYEVVLVGIDKSGEWQLCDETEYLLHADNPKMIQLHKALDKVTVVPKKDGSRSLVSLTKKHQQPIDVVFPVLHGTYGEDGTVQGLLKMADVPFVGAGVLGSAIGMDKDVMKRLLRDAKIPVAKFITIHKSALEKYSFEFLKNELGLPFFVKPANLGSSVGITKVKSEEDWKKAAHDAFLYDRKILVEEFIEARELECSVLGNEEPLVSLPGEVIPQHEFYSYEAKYIDENGAHFRIPVKLEPETLSKIQKLAAEAFLTLCCEGMARVDFFLKANGDVYINEINTIPGFTKISMYPKLWEVSGISYTELIDRLICLAIERFEKEKGLKTTF